MLILRNAGPQGGPGMPEWGMLPIPKKLVKQGVRDMVRLSDARMSGTSYGACILHVSPESFIGGPLALVKTGDRITLDVDKRTYRLDVSDEELARRRAAWKRLDPATSAAMACRCSPGTFRQATKAATSTSSRRPSASPSRSRRSTDPVGPAVRAGTQASRIHETESLPL